MRDFNDTEDLKAGFRKYDGLNAGFQWKPQEVKQIHKKIKENHKKWKANERKKNQTEKNNEGFAVSALKGPWKVPWA